METEEESTHFRGKKEEGKAGLISIPTNNQSAPPFFRFLSPQAQTQHHQQKKIQDPDRNFEILEVFCRTTIRNPRLHNNLTSAQWKTEC